MNEQLFSDGNEPRANDSVLKQRENDLADNPIDRAFSSFADIKGNELKNNVTFSYLHALKWYEEHQSLLDLEDVNSTEKWETNLYGHKMMAAARTYAEKWGGSNKANVIFAEFASFYKMLSYDILSRSDKMVFQTNEEELYQFLCEVSYSQYIPDDYYDDFYMSEYSSDKGNPMVVYADIREKNIHLAFAPPFGVVLSVNDDQYFFKWSNGSLTPRQILPQLYLNDYNEDGTEELAVILYVGSGTGLSVTELHIVDIYGHMSDLAITYETIENLLFHRMSANYDPLSELVTVRLDNQRIDIDTSQADKDQDTDFRGLDLQSIIYFSEKNGSLKVNIKVGLCGFDWVSPFDYVDFYGDIVIDETDNMSLENCYMVYPAS